MVRVLIVDDQVLFRQGLSALLKGRDQIEVVAEAANGETAIDLCVRHRPDVVLMDLKMPGTSGQECTREILSRLPQTRIIALTTFDDDATVFSALRAGAMGYLLKDVGAEALFEAITGAARGQAMVDPHVLSKVLVEFQRVSTADQTRAGAPHGLSEREVLVLKGIAQGKSNKEIAHALRIAEGTTKNHVTSIFEKLGVSDRTSAALRARDLGLD